MAPFLVFSVPFPTSSGQDLITAILALFPIGNICLYVGGGLFSSSLSYFSSSDPSPPHIWGFFVALAVIIAGFSE